MHVKASGLTFTLDLDKCRDFFEVIDSRDNQKSVSASKHSVTDKQLSFCYDISNLFFEVLFMLMCKTAAFRQFI